MATTPTQPSQGSRTVTVTTEQEHALHIVQLQGGGHGAQFSPFPQAPTVQPTPFGGQGQVLGTGNGTSTNPLLAQLAREREARRRRQVQITQVQPIPVPVPVPHPVIHLNLPEGNGVQGPGLLTASGSPDPGPPGPGSGVVFEQMRDAEIEKLLRELLAQRNALLKKLLALFELLQTVPLNALHAEFAAWVTLQQAMQVLEIGTARRMLTAGGGGPPEDPPPGASTAAPVEDPARASLRLANRGRQRRFHAALRALTLQQQLLLNGQALRARRRQNFNRARQALALAPPPILPTMNWQQVVAQHQNFLQAQQALALNPPPLQPGQAWQNMVQAQQNFVQAQQALALHPPPAQPVQAWHDMVQHHANFQAALNQFALNPPQPLLQGPIALNANNAPMPYVVPHHQAQHILYGNHGGGQHMGYLNPALNGAPPNAVTQHLFPGHLVTYFPVAWDAHDILTAVTEAAQASYLLAWQQHNGNWFHPPVWVTRRGITIQITVITSVNFHGQLIVWTAWPT